MFGLGAKTYRDLKLAGYCPKKSENEKSSKTSKHTAKSFYPSGPMDSIFAGPASWRKFGELSVLHFFVLTGDPSFRRVER